MDKDMSKLKLTLQQWLIELYKHKDQIRKNRTIYVRYLEGKIEVLENVLEEIKKFETETAYCIDDECK